MAKDKVDPDMAGLFWGPPQVVCLEKKCTGMPVIRVDDYKTRNSIHDGAKKVRQYNCFFPCKMRQA
jgi:hypothetical protein